MIIDFHIHNAPPDFKNMALAFKRAEIIGIGMMGNLGDVLANGLFPSAEAVRAINDRSLALDHKYQQKMFSFCFPGLITKELLPFRKLSV